MDNVIHLSQPLAAAMTMTRELIKLHSTRNKAGKYDEAIDKHRARYRNYMDEVLGRNEEASEEAVAA